MGIGQEVADKISSGKIGACSSCGQSLDDLTEFQSVVTELEEIEKNGDIEIIEKHSESTTGERLIDLVRFKKNDKTKLGKEGHG